MHNDSFVDFVRLATGGHEPYPYQMRLADEGLPELLAVPTGAGKTMAAVLTWLYRRRFHQDCAVRDSTPRRLVFVLPMRVLAEQTESVVQAWTANLGLDPADVGCHLVLGGENLDSPWRHAPTQDMVIIGTLDMIVSRSLNRGYGESRYLWPIDFGLFNADCHFVYDEVQLMGPALATSRQLHGLRQTIGTAIPCSSTWMSATVPEDRMATVDAPRVHSRVELDDADRSSGLTTRLDAPKRVEQIIESDSKRYAATVASELSTRHRPGTLSIAVLNTVDRARAVFKALQKQGPGAEIILLHSRFRPGDRRRAANLALSAVDATGTGRIVVSTQVIEAGVDISADLLLTEAAPWPSIVQRAGRCNRDGLSTDASVVWIEPVDAKPYETADVAASVAALMELEGETVTPTVLRAFQVSVVEVIEPVLRRKDLVDLFDTLPDLTGNDIDVSRFIRDVDDLDVAVAWRDVGADGPAADSSMPGRNERCPVPVSALRRLLKDNKFKAWRYDHLAAHWVVCSAGDVRPGMLVVLDCAVGCYSSETGWDPDIKGLTSVIVDEPATDDAATADDPISMSPGQWVTLRQHLTDTEAAAARLIDRLQPSGLSDAIRDSIVHAARLHDIGKVHGVFQRSLRQTARSDQEAAAAPGLDVILAKSGGSGRLRHERPNFRHELASALMLLGEGAVALDRIEESNLIVYLVAAHHGRVRLGIRSMPNEQSRDAVLTVLGVQDGEKVAAVSTDHGEIPMSTMDLSLMALGERSGKQSWVARTLALRDRADIGVFRLGFLEAIVRLADWEASRLPAQMREGSDV